MNKKSYLFVLIAILIVFSCDPNTDIGDGDDQNDPAISTEVYKLQMNSDAFLTLVIDDIDADGKSTEGTLYTYDGSSNFKAVTFLNESGDEIDKNQKVLSLTQIEPDYAIIILTPSDPDDPFAFNDVYLFKMSSKEMYYLNPVISTNWWGCYISSEDFALRDDIVRTSFIMDGDYNLYTNAYGSMDSWQVIKIMLNEGTERISNEALTADSFSADQFAVNSEGDIIFGDNFSELFGYRTTSGDTGLFDSPENHDFVRVFTGSDNEVWISSQEISFNGVNLFKIDFSTTTPEMDEKTGISDSAVFQEEARYYRDNSETTFYSRQGVTTISSAGIVSTVPCGTFSISYIQIYKDKDFLFGTVDNDDSTTVVYIGNLGDGTTTWVDGLTGAIYDVAQMNDMAAIPGSIFLSLEQTFSGNVTLYEVQNTGVVNSLSSLSQKQRVVSKVALP